MRISDWSSDVCSSDLNVGQATLRMEVTDQTQVFPGGYELRYDGTTSQWTLSRTDGSASVSGTGSLALDGVHLALGGAPVGGDWFAIKGQTGAAGMRSEARRAGQVGVSPCRSRGAPFP